MNSFTKAKCVVALQCQIQANLDCVDYGDKLQLALNNKAHDMIINFNLCLPAQSV